MVPSASWAGASTSLHRTCKFENRNYFLPDPYERRFDRIHVGASCPPELLPRLGALLNRGGILVTPSGKHHPGFPSPHPLF